MSTPSRSYDRSWEEIENMLNLAVEKMNDWKQEFESCKSSKDADGMKIAARNYKALEGVIKTLKWTLGETGIKTPLE
tara:strand:- start:500 stop:730 length:231 start_codon:yes stop_codon:yes gene_type:complete